MTRLVSISSAPTLLKHALYGAIIMGLSFVGSVAAAASSEQPIDVQAIMPPLSNPAAGLQIKSEAQVAADVARGAAYNETAMPSVPAEFARFRTSTAKLDFGQAQRLGKVRDYDEFAQMQQYVNNAYNGVSVLNTIHTADGQVYDCIPIRQQPALRHGAALAMPPADLKKNAAAEGEACGSGAVPFARLDMHDIIRYPTLRAFLSKGKQAPPSRVKPQNSNGHSYSVVTADNTGAYGYGAGAGLNLWSPTGKAITPTSTGMTLSQIWLEGRDSAGNDQTLEVGWQVQPAAWNTVKSVPFIYFSADGYNQTGCYNLECSGFVQTNNSVTFGSAFASSQFSVSGGTQTLMTVSWQWKNSNWWLNVNGQAIGYYPASQYGSGTLGSSGNALGFEAGGEEAGTSSGTMTGTQLPMGSNQFAATGYQKAAFEADLFAFSSSGSVNYLNLARATSYLSDPKCYTQAMAGGTNSLPLNALMTHNGFYYGGPGCSK